MKKHKLVIKTLIKLIFIFYFSLNIFVYFFQEKMIFFPIKIDNNVFLENEVKIKSNNYNLSAKYIDNSSDKVILFLHGNGGNIQYTKQYEQMFSDLQYNVLFLDYRGYGKSDGKIEKEKDLYIDAESALDWLHKNKKYENKNIVVWGLSLGGAPALELCLKYKFNSLVLNSTFYNMKKMANNNYPFLLNNLLLKYKFENNKKINKIKNKVLFIHGNNDKIIPIENSKKLFEILEKTNNFNFEKKLLKTNGTHNNSIFSDDYDSNFNFIKDFLDK